MMSLVPDLYECLEISRHASAEEIKAAYKQKALKYHPDKNPDGADKFKQVNAAFSVLGDPQKKTEYDQKLGYLNQSSLSSHNHSYTRRSTQPNSRSYNTLDKEVDDVLRRESAEIYQGGSFGKGFMDFGSWYKSKIKEMEVAESSAREASLLKKAHQDLQQQEEDLKHAEARAAITKQLQEEHLRQQQEAEEIARRSELLRSETERLARGQFEKKVAEDIEAQAEVANKAEEEMKVLREKRQQLRYERERMSAEYQNLPTQDSERTDRQRQELQKELEQQQEELTSRIDSIKEQMKNAHLEELRRQNDLKLEEQQEAYTRKLREINDFMEEENEDRDRIMYEMDRARRLLMLEHQSQQFMREIQLEKMKHKEDLRRMREESDQMEAAARAVLEEVRANKLRANSFTSHNGMTTPTSPAVALGSSPSASASATTPTNLRSPSHPTATTTATTPSKSLTSGRSPTTMAAAALAEMR